MDYFVCSHELIVTYVKTAAVSTDCYSLLLRCSCMSSHSIDICGCGGRNIGAFLSGVPRYIPHREMMSSGGMCVCVLSMYMCVRLYA